MSFLGSINLATLNIYVRRVIKCVHEKINVVYNYLFTFF